MGRSPSVSFYYCMSNYYEEKHVPSDFWVFKFSKGINFFLGENSAHPSPLNSTCVNAGSRGSTLRTRQGRFTHPFIALVFPNVLHTYPKAINKHPSPPPTPLYAFSKKDKFYQRLQFTSVTPFSNVLIRSLYTPQPK